MGSEITDDTVEPLAFAVCNTDGVEGLSWAEVEQCEVSKIFYRSWIIILSSSKDQVSWVNIQWKVLLVFCSNFCKTKFFTPFWQEKKMWALQNICVLGPKVGWEEALFKTVFK